MFPAGLFPACDSRQIPYVSHLLPAVDLFHEFIIVVVRSLRVLSGPNDELSAVCKEPTGNIWRRVGLGPCDDVENSETKSL